MKLSVVPENQTLVDQLLTEQRQLTAVDKFSKLQSGHQIPLQQKYYRDLIPLSLPDAGQQYAFEVDLDACSGCKACVTACHSLNGLDQDETWRSVGSLIGGTRSKPFQQTVTTACHHCVEPGCLNGCPVEAYEKDAVTGIVRHLDDQCIGCQYCSWTCPYDVPQYSAKRGIVRKCDMCQSRLAVGEAPACVQACPNGAITIRIVSKAQAVGRAVENTFLPTAPDPKLTVPTTRFISTRQIPDNVESSTQNSLRKQPAHFPLILMLVSTQMAAGVFLLHCVTSLFARGTPRFSIVAELIATALLLAGMFASVFHLGRPFQAWRSFLGWRHSWLSREVLAFGVFAGIAIGALLFRISAAESSFWQNAISVSLSVAGLGAIFCSAMLYHATKRDFWHLQRTGGNFFGTTVLLGCGTLWTISVIHSQLFANAFALGLMIASLTKLAFEISVFRALDEERPSALQNSARLMSGELRLHVSSRILLTLCGGVFLPFFFLVQEPSAMAALAGLFLCILGELFERYLFFTAVAPPRMPGGN